MGSENDVNKIFDETLCCSLLYTFMGDDDQLEFQVYLDLKGNRIIKEISYDNRFYFYENEEYNDWEDLVEVTKDLEFDDLYWVRANISDIESAIDILSL